MYQRPLTRKISPDTSVEGLISMMTRQDGTDNQFHMNRIRPNVRFVIVWNYRMDGKVHVLKRNGAKSVYAAMTIGEFRSLCGGNLSIDAAVIFEKMTTKKLPTVLGHYFEQNITQDDGFKRIHWFGIYPKQ